MNDLKVCIMCERSFPCTKEYFYANKNMKDGLVPRCKECFGKGRKPRPKVPEGHARCTRCEGIFPATKEHFSVNNNRYNGISYYCRKCTSLINAEIYASAKVQGPREVPPPTMICIRCEVEKPATSEHFAVRPAAKYGLCKICKECEDGYRKQWGKGEKRRNWEKEYYKNHRINYFLNRYQTQKDMILTKQRMFKDANPEIVVGWKHNYARSARGRLVHRKSSRKYLARKYGTQGTYTPEDIQQIFAQQEGKCAYCQKPLVAYHIDHIVPLSRGGTNWPDNLALACQSCNCSKKDKLLSEWLPNRH